MTIDPTDHYQIANQDLKRKILSSISDNVAIREAIVSNRYSLNADHSYRPNLFKAREAALEKRFTSCSASEPWLKDLIFRWSQMSGHPPIQADFWNHPRFMESIKKGGGLAIRRYLDDDNWGWITVSDTTNTWVHKMRLADPVTKYLIKRKKAREERFKLK